MILSLQVLKGINDLAGPFIYTYILFFYRTFHDTFIKRFIVFSLRLSDDN
jgi:hypothetical protein